MEQYENNGAIFFSENLITLTMKYTYVMSTAFTKLRLFFPQILLSYQQTFPPLCETLLAGCVKVFAEALELFTHAVFQLVTELGVYPSRDQTVEVSGG